LSFFAQWTEKAELQTSCKPHLARIVLVAELMRITMCIPVPKRGVDWQRSACHFGAMGYGVCKLTGTHGKFVKCHIIPAALTPPEVKGDPLHQGGQGRSVRRISSWYDKALVTRAGEEFLRDLDTWGIRELRQQKLIWSSWGAHTELNTRDHVKLPLGARCRDSSRHRRQLTIGGAFPMGGH
jgi:hypothetical protein